MATAQRDGYQDLLAIEIFHRLGASIDIHIVPGERSLLNLNRGIDDATFVRIRGVEKAYPNLRMVPEKVMDWEFVAFTNDPNIQISNWADLKPYNVAFINGWKIFEKNVQGTKHLTKTATPEQLFDLLENGRAEVVLFEKWSGLHILKQRRMRSARLVTPILARREMFMYVHKRHEGLIPRLADTIRTMKTDGTYDRIFDRTFGNLATI